MSIDFYASPEKFQEQIYQLYKNLNTERNGKVTLSKSQTFVSKYFTPNNPDGILLYHSIGSGKSLASLSIIKSFEELGFNAIFVTRTTLKGDIDKALSMTNLKNKLLRFSYKQFSNICKRKGKNYELLMEKAKSLDKNTSDPFYKTIIVIDEAHKLYTKDLKTQEMHDIKLIQKFIYESYQVSKENRCRIVLLSATPITFDPFEILKLFNLIIVNPKERINLNNFQDEFLDNNGKFTQKGELEFKYLTKGLVSYLDVTKDTSTFAKISLTHVYVPISEKPKLLTTSDCQKSYKQCISIFPKNELHKMQCENYKITCNKEIKNTKLYIKNNKFQVDELKNKCNIVFT
jgi:Type III restriction enzyme, res subunit